MSFNIKVSGKLITSILEAAIISSHGAALKKDASPRKEPGPNFSRVIIFS